MTDGQSEACLWNGPWSSCVCKNCGQVGRDILCPATGGGFLCRECWEAKCGPFVTILTVETNDEIQENNTDDSEILTDNDKKTID